MTTAREVIASLDDVEQTRTALKSLARQRPENWSTDYARRRATLREKVGLLIQRSEDYFRQQGDGAQAEEFARLVTEFKSTLEKHQARWPVLMIDQDKPDYVASMDKVEASNTQVSRFLRANVKD